MTTKFQVKEEDLVYGNGLWIDPVLYDTHDEAMRHCHSTRGWIEQVEVDDIYANACDDENCKCRNSTLWPDNIRNGCVNPAKS